MVFLAQPYIKNGEDTCICIQVVENIYAAALPYSFTGHIVSIHTSNSKFTITQN